MSEYDKWEIAGVLPDDFEDFGDWIVQKSYHGPAFGGGIVYHKHINTLYIVGQNRRCRYCDIQVPAGILFRAKTSKLDNVGVE